MTEPQLLSRAWRGLDVPSTEHLDLTVGEVLSVSSRVVRGDVSLEYTVELDPSWAFRMLRAIRADGLSLELARRANGDWVVEGAARPDLSEAVDIDMVFTPFTNTLPLRRLDLDVGASADIVTAWIDEELEVFADHQRYTRLDRDLYRFESNGDDFVREIVVDAEGFVVDYPDLFIALDTAEP